MRSKILKTVKNTATNIRGFCTIETSLIIIGWIAFAIGIYVIEDPLWKLIILALSRVLP